MNASNDFQNLHLQFSFTRSMIYKHSEKQVPVITEKKTLEDIMKDNLKEKIHKILGDPDLRRNCIKESKQILESRRLKFKKVRNNRILSQSHNKQELIEMVSQKKVSIDREKRLNLLNEITRWERFKTQRQDFIDKVVRNAK